MPNYDDSDRLRHMRDAANKAVEYCKDKTRASLDDDEMLVLALVRLMEIIGEASIKTSPETRTRLSGVQWREIAGTRNRLVHGYADVNLDIVWATISSDLPKLISELEKVLKQEPD